MPWLNKILEYVIRLVGVLSAAGLIITLCLHIGGLLNLFIPPGWLLIALLVGTFVVILPVTLLYHFVWPGRGAPRCWGPVIIRCPLWMKGLFYFSLVYYFIDFGLNAYYCTGMKSGTPLDTIMAGLFAGFIWPFYTPPFVYAHAWQKK